MISAIPGGEKNLYLLSLLSKLEPNLRNGCWFDYLFEPLKLNSKTRLGLWGIKGEDFHREGREERKDRNFWIWQENAPNQKPSAPSGYCPLPSEIVPLANSYGPIRFLGLDHKRGSSRAWRALRFNHFFKLYAATTKVKHNPAPSGTDGLLTKPSKFRGSGPGNGRQRNGDVFLRGD